MTICFVCRFFCCCLVVLPDIDSILIVVDRFFKLVYMLISMISKFIKKIINIIRGFMFLIGLRIACVRWKS